MEYCNNASYIFLPFSFRSDNDFASLNRQLGENRNYQLIRDKIKYMYRYVAEKFNSDNAEACQCFHYKLRPEERASFHLGDPADLYQSRPIMYLGKSDCFRFRVNDAHLFLFNTSVGIVSFQLLFDKNDPFYIANALFYLKNVSKERFLSADGKTQFTFLSVAKEMVGAVPELTDSAFFYYANQDRERANVFSYVEIAPQEDYDKEMYYLRHCYSDGFQYTDEKPDSDEVYSLSGDTVWGVSSEAAVCIAHPKPGNEYFIRRVFYKNFNEQSFFLYTLLLHQRYVLYRFLTKIGVGAYNSLETLETYRAELYEFETNFVFSCVTEVPQYQCLYDRVAKAFSLRQLYDDVHEPLVSLREIRRETSEKEQKKRDDRLNVAVLLLSVLSIFSALVDSFDFNESFWSRFFPDPVVHFIQGFCIAIIMVVAVWLIVTLVRNNRK